MADASRSDAQRTTSLRIADQAGSGLPPACSGTARARKSEEEKLGFWGATPITKPKVTGSRSGGAALVSLLEQLANAGLIVNATSA